jgi:hypothetical protein
MCVTHGLTSVNPKKHLIGHHMDWARGFPFAVFGLPDQYQHEAPSVALFGFDYDDDFLKVLDQPWPGVRAAEAELSREAARQRRAVEDVRFDRQTATTGGSRSSRPGTSRVQTRPPGRDRGPEKRP